MSHSALLSYVTTAAVLLVAVLLVKLMRSPGENKPEATSPPVPLETLVKEIGDIKTPAPPLQTRQRKQGQKGTKKSAKPKVRPEPQPDGIAPDMQAAILVAQKREWQDRWDNLSPVEQLTKEKQLQETRNHYARALREVKTMRKDQRRRLFAQNAFAVGDETDEDSEPEGVDPLWNELDALPVLGQLELLLPKLRSLQRELHEMGAAKARSEGAKEVEEPVVVPRNPVASATVTQEFVMDEGEDDAFALQKFGSKTGKAGAKTGGKQKKKTLPSNAHTIPGLVYV